MYVYLLNVEAQETEEADVDSPKALVALLYERINECARAVVDLDDHMTFFVTEALLTECTQKRLQAAAAKATGEVQVPLWGLSHFAPRGDGWRIICARQVATGAPVS